MNATTLISGDSSYIKTTEALLYCQPRFNEIQAAALANMNTSSKSQEILVIGAGVIGLCTAHYLNKAGYSVRVLERRLGSGLETSFANAGMSTPSMSDPWNAPGVHWTLLKYLGRKDAPLLLRPTAMWQYLFWGLRFLKFSSPQRFDQAMRANFALSSYSLPRLNEMREELGLHYEHRTAGTIKVFRSYASFDSAASDCEKLKGFGLTFDLLNQQQALDLEPVLKGNANSIAGAIAFPDDETGDAHIFCRELQESLIARGVKFNFACEVSQLHVDGENICGVDSNHGFLPASGVVVAAAAWSPKLLKNTKVSVSIKPVKGYSITTELTQQNLMPNRAIIDNELHAAVTPFATRIRLAGTAEFAGWNYNLDQARLNNLWNMLNTINPDLAATTDKATASNWCGFRPMSADGNPYIGSTSVNGLYLNTGHGYLGWTQAPGSGALMTEIINKHPTSIDTSPYRIDRP